MLSNSLKNMTYWENSDDLGKMELTSWRTSIWYSVTHQLHQINFCFYIAPWFTLIMFKKHLFPPLQDVFFCWCFYIVLQDFIQQYTAFFSSRSNSGTQICRLVFIAEVLSSPGCWKVPWCKSCSKLEWSIKSYSADWWLKLNCEKYQSRRNMSKN